MLGRFYPGRSLRHNGTYDARDECECSLRMTVMHSGANWNRPPPFEMLYDSILVFIDAEALTTAKELKCKQRPAPKDSTKPKVTNIGIVTLDTREVRNVPYPEWHRYFQHHDYVIIDCRICLNHPLWYNHHCPPQGAIAFEKAVSYGPAPRNSYSKGILRVTSGGSGTRRSRLMRFLMAFTVARPASLVELPGLEINHEGFELTDEEREIVLYFTKMFTAPFGTSYSSSVHRLW